MQTFDGVTISVAMANAKLNPALRRWLDRLAEIVDASEAYPDARPVGALLADIVAKVPLPAETPVPSTPPRSAAAPNRPARTCRRS